MAAHLRRMIVAYTEGLDSMYTHLNQTPLVDIDDGELARRIRQQNGEILVTVGRVFADAMSVMLGVADAVDSCNDIGTFDHIQFQRAMIERIDGMKSTVDGIVGPLKDFIKPEATA
jgi:hypothetical protein